MRLPVGVTEAMVEAAHSDDRETSLEAAERIILLFNKTQMDVLEHFMRAGRKGLTDSQLTKALDPSGRSTMRTRRAELTNMGLIVDSGRRKYRVRRGTGRSTAETIWVLRAWYGRDSK